MNVSFWRGTPVSLNSGLERNTEEEEEGESLVNALRVGEGGRETVCERMRGRGCTAEGARLTGCEK